MKNKCLRHNWLTGHCSKCGLKYSNSKEYKRNKTIWFCYTIPARLEKKVEKAIKEVIKKYKKVKI